MSKTTFTLALLGVLLSNFIFGQNTAPVWSSYYQGKGDNSDRYNQVVADGQGDFVGAGYSFRSGNYRDFLTVKFNANGDTLWTRTKNGIASGMDEAVAVAIDASGNVFVVGYTDGGTSNNDILLIKYDAFGLKLFDTTWNSPSSLDDIPVAIAIDGGGNVFVGGLARPDTLTGSNDYITLKFNNNGGLLWATQFSRSGVTGGKDEMAGLVLDTLGNVYVTGRSSNGADDDFVTLKYSGSTGAQLWMQVFNSGNGNDRASAIAIDNTGFILVTGRSKNGTGNDDFRTVKYSSTGSLQWSKFYNAPANQDDRATAITTDVLGNVYVTGESDLDNTATINYDFATVKYNSAGTQQWSKIIGSVFLQYDIPSSIVVDGSGNIFVTGKSDQNPGLSDNNDWMTVMYNSSGTLMWTDFKSGTNVGKGDTPGNLVLDASSNVYVVGSLENLITQKDATVVKYDINGTELFAAGFNGQGDFNDNAKNIVIDVSDNSYTCGYSFVQDLNKNATIIQIDPSGNRSCLYSFSGIKADDDEFNDLAIGPNGNITAVGYTKVSGQKSDFLIVKINPATCDTIWTRTYDYVAQSDKADALFIDGAGNIYVTGRSDSNPVDSIDNIDIVTIKFDTNGNLLWLQRFNGTGNLRDEPSRILVDGVGDVLVCGRTENVHDDDFMVIKYNGSTGAPVWASPSIYGGPFANDDRPLDMTIDGNNNIFLCGYSQTGSGNSTEDPVVVKFDQAGNFSGFYSYSGIGADEATSIGHDLAGNIYVTFKTDVNPDPLINDYDILTMKYDNNLNPLWTNPPQFDGLVHKSDVPSKLLVTPAGSVYVTGYTENDTLNGKTNRNWITLLYDDLGAQLMSANFDGPNAGDDAANSMALRGSSLWVCGYVDGLNLSQKDNAVLRYNVIVGVNEISKSISSFAFPNPFSDQSQIQLNGNDSKVEHSIVVYDLLGSLVYQHEFFGDKTIVSKNNLAAGVYHYSISEKLTVVSRGKLIIK